MSFENQNQITVGITFCSMKHCLLEQVFSGTIWDIPLYFSVMSHDHRIAVYESWLRPIRGQNA